MGCDSLHFCMKMYRCVCAGHRDQRVTLWLEINTMCLPRQHGQHHQIWYCEAPLCKVRIATAFLALQFSQTCASLSFIPASVWQWPTQSLRGFLNSCSVSAVSGVFNPFYQQTNPLTAKLSNLNFHSLEVVNRVSDPQLQVSENYSDLTKWRSTLLNSCWLMSHFIFNIFKMWYLMCW